MFAVRLPNWLGDVCLAMRAVDALHAFAERAGAGPLSIVSRPWARALWSAHWPGAAWLDAPSSGGRWLPAVPSLARAHLNTLVLLPPSLSARLHAFAAGVPVRVGLANESGGFLLTKSAPRGARGTRHLEDEYLDLARVVGASPVPRRALVLPAEAEARARAVEERTG
ncbi:MAG: glycosyltransferase family 9 protein, partial [Candidatus Eiseniibacteriota bacterium]